MTYPTEPLPELQPLPYKQRKTAFILLFTLFIITLPFLYLYATGYRFEFGETTNLVSTGGIYVASDRTGAEIYIDGELVRETRVFRRAFYAQNLEPGTHRVHVQKEGHHTWVKELPVTAHLVTEAAAFNLPLVPQVRTITAWQSATGSAVLFEPMPFVASSTNEFLIASTTATGGYSPNSEYASLLSLFGTTTATSSESLARQVAAELTVLFTATSSATSTATTTKTWRDTVLFAAEGDVYARYVGVPQNMPYYYCAEDFPPYSTSTTPVRVQVERELTVPVLHPVEPSIEGSGGCDPTIRMDRQGKAVQFFDFLPGSSDLVLLHLADGLYLSEIDDRGWQNTQPVVRSDGLSVRIENGRIYVYDGKVIYDVII